MNTRERLRLVAAVVVPAIAADQVTKAWAVAELDDRSISVLPTVDFALTYNSGFSFGTGEGLGPLVGIVVTAIVGFIAWRMWLETDRRRLILLAAVFGGAVGNLIDRLFRTDGGWPLTGEVVDFIDVSWYAVFNVADAVLVVAVIVFIVTEWFAQRQQPTPESSGDPDAAR